MHIVVGAAEATRAEYTNSFGDRSDARDGLSVAAGRIVGEHRYKLLSGSGHFVVKSCGSGLLTPLSGSWSRLGVPTTELEICTIVELFCSARKVGPYSFSAASRTMASQDSRSLPWDNTPGMFSAIPTDCCESPRNQVGSIGRS